MAKRPVAKKSVRAPRKRRAPKNKKRPARARSWRRALAYFAAGFTVALVLFVVYLDHVVRTKFEGRRWAVPAHVYARPLELYRGESLRAAEFLAELKALGYRAETAVDRPGSFRRQGGDFVVESRPFVFWDGPQPAINFGVSFDQGQVASVYRPSDGSALPLVRMEPVLIGSIQPSSHEDRILIRLQDAPTDLVAGLVAVEDHDFFHHHGIDPRGLARALLADIRAGRAVQGGSTLTQQLVKNFYLTADRTLTRKFMEMIMAVLLEVHYSKEEILQAYLNEVYLGQQGNRAIHGFGLASQYYFHRPLEELKLPEIALLVGMIRGPSYYNPRRHPERALARRNLVLREMESQGVIDPTALAQALRAPLGVAALPPGGATAYGAFLDLVRRQLERNYRDEDLRSEGLQIFTTLDLRVQRAAAHALNERLGVLERARRLDAGTFEGAAVVTSTADGEVLAVVGGRSSDVGGFDRALDAKRPIGSLAKPAAYLTALMQPDRYTLATPLDDGPLTWRAAGTKPWTPHNYDKRYHGKVPLYLALAHSYNVATARLGLSLGIDNVLDTMHRMGVDEALPPYPSTFLGACALTPLDVARMYQTIASGGFRVPLRAIRDVVAADGKPLQRYGLDVKQVFKPAPVYLLTTAMQEVVRQGTARSLVDWVPASLNVAGKTGTTDDYRDSWFAGITGNLMAVVWVGRDDNHSVGLTGAGGAMQVWGDMMRRIGPEPLVLQPPDNVVTAWIDPTTGLRADSECTGAISLPFIRGSAPTQRAPCAGGGGPARGAFDWLKRLFR